MVMLHTRLSLIANSVAALGVCLVLGACEEVPRMYSTRGAGGHELVRDTFDGPELGPQWRPSGPGATIADGALVVAGVQNHPVWLRTPLPHDVRIEFDAWASSEEGDIKVELFGDGTSAATSANYVASGYVVIFGGWNNTQSAIIRKREHGRERETTSELKVVPDRRYHFALTRVGGELAWELDGREVLVFDDAKPLAGEGNQHFAFSGWEATTRFDNLVIEAL